MGNDIERFFEEMGAQPYHRALYKLCKDFDPTCTIEVGTYDGIGALCLALTGKPIVTIDTNHQRLRETMQKHKDFLIASEIEGIRAMTTDFRGITSGMGEERTFLFYDIHDGEISDHGKASKHLIENWIPTLEDALVAVHDIVEGIRPEGKPFPVSFSRAILWDGREFWGWGECKPIIDLLNKHEAELIQVKGTKSLVYFYVKDGVPQ